MSNLMTLHYFDSIKPRQLAIMRKIMMFPGKIILATDILNGSLCKRIFYDSIIVLASCGFGNLIKTSDTQFVFEKVSLNKMIASIHLLEQLPLIGLEIEAVLTILAMVENVQYPKLEDNILELIQRTKFFD